MKKIFVLGVLMSPMAAFGLDMTGCETIGYWQSTMTTCDMYDDCINTRAVDDPDPAAACNDLPRTAEECAEKISRQNIEDAKDTVLIKCPVTDARLADKNAEKDFAVCCFRFASIAGDDIQPDVMWPDDEFVYYLKLSKEVSYDVTGNDEGAWAVIGKYDENDGLYMSIVK